MIEIILELAGEFLLQAFGEVLLEIGLQSLSEPLRRKPNPWLAAIAYANFGALAGGLSLLVFKEHMVPEPWRIANLIVTPLLVGAIMSVLGSLRMRRGEPVLGIDRFAYGYVFALAIALVRFIYAE